MIAKRAAGSGDEPLHARSGLHPQPEGVLGIEHLHPLPLIDEHLVLFQGLEVMDDHQLLQELLREGVHGRLAHGRPPVHGGADGSGVGHTVHGLGGSWVASGLWAVRVLHCRGVAIGVAWGWPEWGDWCHGGAVSAAVPGQVPMRNAILWTLPEAGVDAVGRGHVSYLCLDPVPPTTPPGGGHVSVVARLVAVSVRHKLWLRLVACILPGGTHIVVRDVAGFSVLCHGVDPVVVLVEDLDPLPLPQHQLLIAARVVVLEGSHADVCRPAPGGQTQHLALKGPIISLIARGEVCGVAVVATRAASGALLRLVLAVAVVVVVVVGPGQALLAAGEVPMLGAVLLLVYHRWVLADNGLVQLVDVGGDELVENGCHAAAGSFSGVVVATLPRCK